MAKILGLKQLLQRKYKLIEGLPEDLKNSVGELEINFIMIIWGQSANGKSRFLMNILKAIMLFGRVLYVGLEEGFTRSMQRNATDNLSAEVHTGLIGFADHEMTYDVLMKKLARPKSPQFIVIDSVQYWDIDYAKYRALKERFPKKAFIFISHASGKLPDGKTADKIRYDAGVKIRVEGFVAFVGSRYGGNNPYVIWEEGAKLYWGKKYRQVIKGVIKTTPKKKKSNETIQPSAPA